VADALLKSANAERRADRAAGLAVRFEVVIPCDPAWGRTRARLSALHRRTEARHRAVAQLHRAYAALLQQRLGAQREQEANAFLAAVPAVLGMQSASVTLQTGTSAEGVLASDRTAYLAQELEFTLGEGPARDCLSTGPLWATSFETRRRWPHYGTAVADLGVLSLAAVPLQVDDAPPLGSLVVFGPRSRAADLDRLMRIGSAFTEVLLDEWGEHAGRPSALPDIDHRPIVQQAAGIVAHRSDCSPADALALLRARAFAEDADVADVAQQVIDGTCSLDG